MHIRDVAPDFSLTSHDGTAMSLTAMRALCGIVLIFYPRDSTPGCTAQLCAVRDDYDFYNAAGICVYGISGGSASSHERFATRNKLPVPLLVDSGLRVAKKYDATIGVGPLRIIRRTVVGIKQTGRIVFYERGAPATMTILAAFR